MKQYTPEENHYIFSDPRGGSTWLMEIIQLITQDPVIMEPLGLGLKNSPFKALNFGWRQHIPEHEDWKEAKGAFDCLFSGKILNHNILNHSTLTQVLNSKNLLFKICRGNTLLPWFSNKYCFAFKPIYLIRHPFAVVNSQLKHGAWNGTSSKFDIPNTPYNDIYQKHNSFLSTITTTEEVLVAHWCLSNFVPLNHSENNKRWITINYEDLVLNPERNIKRILSSWSLDFDLSLIDFEQNSATTKRNSPESTIKRISSWQEQLTKSQIDKMSRVLDYFQIDVYSKKRAMPDVVFK
ncbi:MAG: sulfotransferase domain-containing protein [Brumimicrobium sp.]